MGFRKKRLITSSEEAARRWASRLYWSILGMGLVLLYYIVSAILRRPFFSSLCVVVGLLLRHYLTQADSMWHQSQYLENQFWMLVTFLFTGNCMFAPDSPYRLTDYLTPFIGRVCGWLIVFGCTMAAHFLDKHHHRTRLKLNPVLDQFYDIKSASAQGKVEILNKLLSQLDRTLPSTLHALWNIKQYVQIERDILSVFSDCSKEELNYVILKTEMKLLVYKLKNHNKSTQSTFDLNARMYTKQNRSRSMLMEIIAVRRASDLNLASRAVVIDIIQSLRMTMHPDTKKEAEDWVKNLLLNVKGSDLSDLKQLIDNKGSAESMHKLIYEDITCNEVRSKILQHFEKQASIQAAHKSMGGSLAKKIMLKSAWRKILSDVDDTLFSSGGRHPAGIDHTYKRKVFYPGITALYKELDLGMVGQDAVTGWWSPKRFGDLVFLSARPHVYKDLTEAAMYTKFRKFMKTQNLHCMPTLLFGDMESGQAFMMQGDFNPMALKKLKNFEQYYSIYPEFTHVFIGDNGQADVKAAEMMIEKYGRKVVERVFIHEVQPRQFTFGYEPYLSEDKWEKYGIVFCKTYVGAALHAATGERPLILKVGLRRVAVAARYEFLRIKHTWKDPYERDLRRLELNKDIAAANEALRNAGLETVDLIPGQREFPVGTLVYTGFGRGFVGSYRPSDGMYEVFLDWKASASQPARLYTFLHSMFATERELKEFHKDMFSQDRIRNAQAANFPPARARSSTNDTDISAFSAQTWNEKRASMLQQSNGEGNSALNAGGGIVSVVSQDAPATPAKPRPGTAAVEHTGSSSPASSSVASNATLTPTPTPHKLADFAESAEAIKENASPKLVPIAPASVFPGISYFTPVISYPGSARRGYFRRRNTTDDVVLKRHLSGGSSTTTGGATSLSRSNTASSTSSLLGQSKSEHPETVEPSAPSSSSFSSSSSQTSNLTELIVPPMSLSGDLEPKSADSTRDSSKSSTSLETALIAVADKENTELNDVLEMGTKVKTPYGQGVVLRFRELDDIYQLAIPKTGMAVFVTEETLILWNQDLFKERAKKLAQEGSYPSRLFGLMRKLFVRGDGTLAQPSSSSSKVLPKNTIVDTQYGTGSVENFREADRMYQVRLVWGAVAYLPASCVKEKSEYNSLSSTEAALAMQKDQSPLQKAKEIVAKNWAFLKLPFSVVGSSLPFSGRSGVKNALPPSDSMLSLSSLVSASSTLSSGSYFSLPEEYQRVNELWRLGVGDQVDASPFGVGTVLQVREDSIFVVQLKFGVAYIHVPRLLIPGLVDAPETPVPVGRRVLTQFGYGKVEAYRPEDFMYCLKMDKWNAQVYICMGSPSPAKSPVRTLSQSSFTVGQDLTEQEESGSFKSTILSFISNIIPGSSPLAPVVPEEEEDNEDGSDAVVEFSGVHYTRASFHEAKYVGHTKFSFECPVLHHQVQGEHVQTGEQKTRLTEKDIPPGHTAFSWGLEPVSTPNPATQM